MRGWKRSKKCATSSAPDQLNSKGQKDKDKILCPVCDQHIWMLLIEKLAMTQFFETAPVKLGYTGTVHAGLSKSTFTEIIVTQLNLTSAPTVN